MSYTNFSFQCRLIIMPLLKILENHCDKFHPIALAAQIDHLARHTKKRHDIVTALFLQGRE